MHNCVIQHAVSGVSYRALSLYQVCGTCARTCYTIISIHASAAQYGMHKCMHVRAGMCCALALSISFANVHTVNGLTSICAHAPNLKHCG